jgi:hypothetical protein
VKVVEVWECAPKLKFVIAGCIEVGVGQDETVFAQKNLAKMLGLN